MVLRAIFGPGQAESTGPCHLADVASASQRMPTCLISGLFAGVAAIVMMARFNSAKADYGE
jgi:ribose/xylose/arabinose/galactoside ABC-type transport system permease subunit